MCVCVLPPSLTGQFRPLMKLVRSNAATTVKTITSEAIRSCDASAEKDPISILSQLKGIGPATASAILSVVPACGGRYPFMADEAMEASGLKLEYTPKAYRKFTEILNDKAASLGTPWTAELVGRALWAHALTATLNDDDEDITSKSIVTKPPENSKEVEVEGNPLKKKGRRK
jgi:hypothetical protein